MSHVQAVIPIAIRKLKKVEMRLPPPRLFDELLGCRGDKRFFALWWSRSDQAPVMNDGTFESAGIPAPYRVWRYHPAVMAALAWYNIGDAALTADHWLLVDRKARSLYAGKVWDVLDVLDYQKSGLNEPRNGACPAAGCKGEMDLEGEGGGPPVKRMQQAMISGGKQLDELEAWLDANIAVG